jgi:3-oxoacyl-[acyl-carrier-protein] synthase II
MKRRVVLTGLGIVTSLGQKVDQVWSALLAGKSGIHHFKVIDGTAFDVKIGGDIYEWDCGDYVDKREVKRLDRFCQFAMVAAIDALNHSGLDLSKIDRTRGGVILGSGIGGLGTIEEQMLKMVEKGVDRVSPMTVPRMMLNGAGGAIAIRFGLQGTNYSVATACASATNALGDAFKTIQRGEHDVMISGGSEAAITRMGVSAFQNMKALSARNDRPEAASRPFDRDRDGFVLSEGAGIVVMEDLEHAQSRGAKILAEVIGFGTTCDAGHITQPDENGLGAARAMSRALQDGGIGPAEVDYINAHGTSTPLGDKAETIAVKNVYGDSAYKVSISSTKSQLGHSLGASGGIELVISVKTLLEQTIAPTINLDNPDPECDLDYTPNQPRQRKVDIVMSNSFGFGGHNASIVIRKY